MLRSAELRLKIRQTIQQKFNTETKLERELVHSVIKTLSKAVNLESKSGKDPSATVYAFRIHCLDEKQFLRLVNTQLQEKYPFVASFAADHPCAPELRYLKICVPALQAVPPVDTLLSLYCATPSIPSSPVPEHKPTPS